MAISLYLGLLGAYLLAVWLHPSPLDVRMLINNLYFLVPTAFVAAVGTVVRGRLLWQDLHIRIELAESNQRLAKLARHDARPSPCMRRSNWVRAWVRWM